MSNKHKVKDIKISFVKYNEKIKDLGHYKLIGICNGEAIYLEIDLTDDFVNDSTINFNEFFEEKLLKQYEYLTNI
jgi:hypothetical protein